MAMNATLELHDLILSGCDAEFAVLFYDPGELRDEKGRWTSSAGDHLAAAPIKRIEPLGGGVNETHLVTLEGGKQGVWKTASAKKEIIISKLASKLGMGDMVPATVEREVNGKIGSIQEYVDKGIPGKNVSNKFDGPKDLARAAAFDYLTGQVDRHDGNWMLTRKPTSLFKSVKDRLTGRKPEGDKMKLIDNGEVFPVEEKAKDMENQDLLREASSLKIPDLSHWKWSDVEPVLKGLDGEAIKLAKARLDALTSSGGKSFSELPYAGEKLGDVLQKQARGFRVI